MLNLSVSENFGKYPRRWCLQQFSGSVVGTEQCLTLVAYLVPSDVYRPCLFWLHGGWFITGDSLQHGLTSGEFFAEVHGVITVSAQYRLAVLGYLALPDLPPDDFEAERRVGAYGFQDQEQALNWVHSNALSLEGNESQIIVLGLDAGAFSACFRIFTVCSHGFTACFHGFTFYFHALVANSRGFTVYFRWVNHLFP